MGYIGSHGVAALHRYKYSGVDHSYVAKYVLQPFWTRFVNFFPLWMPWVLLSFEFWLHCQFNLSDMHKVNPILRISSQSFFYVCNLVLVRICMSVLFAFLLLKFLIQPSQKFVWNFWLKYMFVVILVWVLNTLTHTFVLFVLMYVLAFFKSSQSKHGTTLPPFLL